MAMTDVLAQIDAEIAKLEQVKVLLTGTAAPVTAKRGRPKGSKSTPAKAPAKAAKAVKKTAKRVLSPEVRKKIADAQKARWAKAKGEA